jgi:hypothetical protein
MYKSTASRTLHLGSWYASDACTYAVMTVRKLCFNISQSMASVHGFAIVRGYMGSITSGCVFVPAARA